MDSLRGQDEIGGHGAYDDEAIEAPPVISGSERRMQVRAYNYWVSLLGQRSFPSIEDLNPEDMEDFGSNSVLLDFSLGLENPAILYLGSALRDECGITGAIERIDQVPPRSLLSRLTDHYLQIIANAAPVGFEAEFTNQRGVEILYRGILMPFSSNDETIDFIYGVINWKEAVSQTVLDGLGEEIRAVMDASPVQPSHDAPIWAEGASIMADFDFEEDDGAEEADSAPAAEAVETADADGAELDLASFPMDEPLDLVDLAPVEGDLTPLPALDDEDEEEAAAADVASAQGLGAQLLAARRSAAEAGDNDVRSRAALYRAIGTAYDFALSAQEAPEDYAAMLADADISVQARSPNTAIIKLVFGADHDKTRIAEYACALDHGFEQGIGRGALDGVLLSYEGGLKGLVKDIRAARRAGKPAGQADRSARRIERAVQKLSDARGVAPESLSFDAHGLAVVVARRDADGAIALVAGVDMDDKATQKILIEASKSV
ncbi:MAG: hypothetical protein AB7E05_01935 [Sphingobium sp.]